VGGNTSRGVKQRAWRAEPGEVRPALSRTARSLAPPQLKTQNSKPKQKPSPASFAGEGFCALQVGGDVLSHRGNPAVPSAQRGLTSEFGMGSGDPPRHAHRPSLVYRATGPWKGEWGDEAASSL